MRVIAGQWRGRRIAAPKGESTRPTADRTRETLFNMLTSRLGSFENLSVADLFAGSGALGIEALSRGAEHCLFVEQDKAALDAIRANLKTLEAARSGSVNAGSVLSLPPAKAPHDLIMLDPPYYTGAAAVAVERLVRLGWIGAATWVAVEMAADEPAEFRGMDIAAERKVGKARIRLLRLPAED